MPTPTIRVLGHVIALDGKADELKALLTSLVEPTRRRSGCIQYDLVQNLADPTDFMFVEEWKDIPLHDEHLASPLIQDAIQKLDGLVAAPPDIRRYQQIA